MAAASSSRCTLGLGRALQHTQRRSSTLVVGGRFAVASPSSSSNSSNRRSLHSLPPLPGTLQEGRGCYPVFSPTAVDLLWNHWQGGLLNKLNEEVRGTQWEHSSLVETVVGTARDPHLIQAFNYASLALNNAFFLSNLKEKVLPPNVKKYIETPPPKPPASLAEAIEKNFESIPAFKLAFSSMAFGMSGSGYVWLVRDREGHMGIVPTYGAGTILIQNRIQNNGASSAWVQASIVDKPSAPSQPPSSSPSSPAANPQQFSNQSRMISTSAKASFSSSLPALATGRSAAHGGIDGRGEELFPILCVSVHERDWLPDFGMWGKEEYLSLFWECVDWQRVHQLWESYRGL